MKNGMLVGEALSADPRELLDLVKAVRSGNITATKVDRQADGDTRFWGVDPSQSSLLARLKQFGDALYQERTGTLPSLSFIMVNDIDASRTPNGSGGGWHRDSFRPQYKAFLYLTEVTRESQGAFCFIPGSNSRLIRLGSAGWRLFSGANRYDDAVVSILNAVGTRPRPVLLPAGVPFFVDTSLIHRGLPIKEGNRVMATVYMFDETPAMFAPLADQPV